MGIHVILDIDPHGVDEPAWASAFAIGHDAREMAQIRELVMNARAGKR